MKPDEEQPEQDQGHGDRGITANEAEQIWIEREVDLDREAAAFGECPLVWRHPELIKHVGQPAEDKGEYDKEMARSRREGQ